MVFVVDEDCEGGIVIDSREVTFVIEDFSSNVIVKYQSEVPYDFNLEE
jgi:hypothetical protein